MCCISDSAIDLIGAALASSTVLAHCLTFYVVQSVISHVKNLITGVTKGFQVRSCGNTIFLALFDTPPAVSLLSFFAVVALALTHACSTR
jgi:hypothetical protein